MRKTIYTILWVALFGFIQTAVDAQLVKVKPVELLPGQSIINPTVVDSTLYFASDVSNSFLVNYINDEDGKEFYHLYKVALKNHQPVGTPEPLLANADIKTNQVAVAFDDKGRAFVTQNNLAIDTKKGKALSVMSYRDLTAVKGMVALPHAGMNNNAYASISPDGTFMVFASDQKNGYGSSDLYVCEKTRTGWGTPVNMGPKVNTAGAETTPFVHKSGKIFFASNGQPGSKKLDIYYTYKQGNSYVEPIRYEVNSGAEDYGFYISENEEWGFLTSTRHGIDRIYTFTVDFPRFPNAAEWEEEVLCYNFTEESAQYYDASEFDFKWTFSDGGTEMGIEVDHCFPGVGEYDVKLSVIDKVSKDEMFNIAEYEVDIEKIEQLDIKAPENITVGKKVTFDVDASGIKSFKPKAYYWELGEGTRMKGKKVQVTFDKAGTYRILCGTISDTDSSQSIATYINVEVEEATTGRTK